MLDASRVDGTPSTSAESWLRTFPFAAGASSSLGSLETREDFFFRTDFPSSPVFMELLEDFFWGAG